MRFVILPDGRVDAASGAVLRADHAESTLRPKELALLCRLATEPRVPVSRETLYEDVWGYHPGTRSRTLDSTVRSLRKTLEAEPGRPVTVQTVAGVGYVYVPPERHDEARLALERGVAEVAAALKTAPLVVLHGPPGSGRTTWLRHVPVAEGLLASWVDLGDEPGPQGFMRALGLRRADQIIPVLQGAEPRLWLVDNADDETALGELEAWARAAPSHRWVVARRARPPTAAPRIGIPPLGPGAARALFVHASQGEVEDDALLQALLDLLGGSPGAIVAVARASRIGLRSLLSQVERGKLGEAAATAPLVRAVAAARGALPQVQRDLFDLLSGMRRPLPMAIAERLGPATELGALVDQGLATLDADSRISALAVSRRPPEEADRARLAEAVAAWVDEALHPLAGPTDTAAAKVLDALASTLPDLGASVPPAVHLAVLHAAHRSGAPLPASPELRRCWPAVWAWFQSDDLEGGLAALERCDAPLRRGATTARLLRLHGDLAQVLHDEPPADASGVDFGLWCLEVGVVHQWSGAGADGVRWAARAVRAMGSAPLPRARARAVLADIQLLGGFLDAADASYGHGLESPEPYLRMRASMGRALLAMKRRDRPTALAHVQEASALVRRVERHSGSVAALIVGEYYSALGQVDAARQMALFALDSASTDPDLSTYLSDVQRVLGRVHLETGELEAARQAFRRAAQARTPRHQAHNQVLASIVSELLGDEQAALAGYRAAIDQLGPEYGGATALGVLAAVPLGLQEAWTARIRTLAQTIQEPALGDVAHAVEAASLPVAQAALRLDELEQASGACCFFTRLAVRLTRHRLGLLA